MSRPTPHYHHSLLSLHHFHLSRHLVPLQLHAHPLQLGGLDSGHNLQWRGQVRRLSSDESVFPRCCCCSCCCGCYFPLPTLRSPSALLRWTPSPSLPMPLSCATDSAFPFPPPQMAIPTALTSTCPISPPRCLTSNASILRCASLLPAQRLRTVIRAHSRATGLLSSNWACGIKGRCGVKGTCGIQAARQDVWTRKVTWTAQLLQ